MTLQEPEKPRASLVLSGGTVVTMNGDREVFADGAVAVNGREIVGVGSRRAITAQFDADQVVDTRDHVVLPGLVNGHTHSFQTLLRGVGTDLALLDWLSEGVYPLVPKLHAPEARVGAQLASLEMIRSGVTCFADSFYLNHDPEAIITAAEAVEESGMRAVLARASADRGDIAANIRETTADALANTAEAVISWKRRSSSASRVTICPEALFTIFSTPQLYAGLHEIAREHGTRFHMHAGESLDEAMQVRRETGRSIFEHLALLDALGPDVLVAHGVWTAGPDIEILAERGASVCYNPVSNQYIGCGVAPVPEMRRRGVNVCLGTDGAASNDSQDFFEVMKAGALLQKVANLDPAVITYEDILEMATVSGAIALGMADLVGSLEPGKRADVTIVDLHAPHAIPAHDPLSNFVYAGRAADVRSVVIDGSIVMRDREVQTLDEERVLAQAREVGHRLTGDAGRSPRRRFVYREAT